MRCLRVLARVPSGVGLWTLEPSGTSNTFPRLVTPVDI